MNHTHHPVLLDLILLKHLCRSSNLSHSYHSSLLSSFRLCFITWVWLLRRMRPTVMSKACQCRLPRHSCPRRRQHSRLPHLISTGHTTPTFPHPYSHTKARSISTTSFSSSRHRSPLLTPAPRSRQTSRRMTFRTLQTLMPTCSLPGRLPCRIPDSVQRVAMVRLRIQGIKVCLGPTFSGRLHDCNATCVNLLPCSTSVDL